VSHGSFRMKGKPRFEATCNRLLLLRKAGLENRISVIGESPHADFDDKLQNQIHCNSCDSREIFSFVTWMPLPLTAPRNRRKRSRGTAAGNGRARR
jgi:hypothetical protein